MEKRKPLKVKKEPTWKRWVKNVALTLGISVGVSSCGSMSDKAENLSLEDLKMKKHTLNMKQNKNAMEIMEFGSIDAAIKAQEFDDATKSILSRDAKDYIKKADEYLKKGADLGYYTEAVKALLPKGNYLISAENGGKPEMFVQSAQGKVQVGEDSFKSFTTNKMDSEDVNYVMNMVATQYSLNSNEGNKYVEAIIALRAIETAMDKATTLIQSNNISSTFGSKAIDTTEAEKAFLVAHNYIKDSGSGRTDILEIIEEDAPIIESPIISVKVKKAGKSSDVSNPKHDNRLANRER